MRCGRCCVLTLLALFGCSLSAFAQSQPQFNLPPYEGSREHVGVLAGNTPQKQFFFDRRSLVKTWIFKDHEAEAPEPLTYFAEPKSWYNMVARANNRSKLTNPPVKVLLMKPGGKAAVWPIGPLPAGTYMFRIIGAIPAADQVQPPKLMTISFTINDRLDGSKSQYVLRARGVDSFYCVQEFGFHAVDDRKFTAEVQMLDDSQTSLYAYNFEIHDILAGCAERAGKTQPSFFTLAERDLARKRYAETDEGKKVLATIKAESKKLTPDQRFRRDFELWNAPPPLNGHIIQNYMDVQNFQRYAFKTDYLVDRDKGKWWQFHRLYGGEYGSGWDQKFELGYDDWLNMARRPLKPQEIYTREDYLAHKPLGDTGDRGWGVVKGNTLVMPFARINDLGWNVYARQFNDAGAMDRYHLSGDELYARDMAFALIRFAWDMPTFSTAHCVGYLTSAGDIPWRDPGLIQWSLVNPNIAMAYDKLFPFIQGNDELAKAVGRYIPSIKTPQDVIKMLDTHLVQYMAKNVLEGRLNYDNDTADILLNLAIVQADGNITEPWMEHLWTRGVYFYPIGCQPLPHVLSTNTGRDGTSPIGSISYAGSGGPAFKAAERIDMYMRVGGLAKYDLRDFNRYPEAIAGCYWPLESAVAGQQYLGIGDVGGPSERYGRFVRPEVNARIGWKWTGDPEFAWLIANVAGRLYETDEEWAAITKAAQGLADPIMTQRSRVLADWSGILESGVGNPDFRFHRVAAVRVGTGYGHHHADTLDLRVWAHGLTMLGDLGQRGGYGKPSHTETMTHNLVQIDEDNQNVHSWVSDLADLPGVQYLEAQAVPTKPGALKRQTALIDVDEGTPSTFAKNPQMDDKAVTPNSYVFDVCRTQGGAMHTFAFHGCVDDLHFDINVPENARTIWPRDATPERAALEKQDADAAYMKDFRWTRTDQTDPDTGKVMHLMGNDFKPADADWVAVAPEDTLQATWRLSRAAEARMIEGERGIGGKLTEPRKYTRLHLFNVKGLRVLHGIVIDKVNAAVINPDYPHYAGREIYVRKPGNESVFVSLVEPYAGEPFILGRKPLEVQPADASSNGPVAVEVVVNTRRNGTAGKRTDILFADNTGQPRTIPAHGIAVQGEFAVVQRTAAGVERAVLSRGTTLKTGDFEITLQHPEYRAKIVKVNYLTRELTLDSKVPAVFKGAEVEIADRLRSTCYKVGDVFERDGVSVLKLPKSLELKRGRVAGVKTAGGRSVIENSMGNMAEDGCWVANGDYSKLWRAVVKTNDPQVTVQGAAGPADFKPAGGDIITLEIGPGMDVVLPAKVSVEKTADGWSVRSNMAGKVKLPGGGVKDLTPE